MPVVGIHQWQNSTIEKDDNENIDDEKLVQNLPYVVKGIQRSHIAPHMIQHIKSGDGLRHWEFA